MQKSGDFTSEPFDKSDDAKKAVSALKYQVGIAAKHVGEESVQLHFSKEMLFFRWFPIHARGATYTAFDGESDRQVKHSQSRCPEAKQ